jgi:hypothetical protein
MLFGGNGYRRRVSRERSRYCGVTGATQTALLLRLVAGKEDRLRRVVGKGRGVFFAGLAFVAQLKGHIRRNRHTRVPMVVNKMTVARIEIKSMF